jgi:hypothetical protein
MNPTDKRGSNIFEEAEELSLPPNKSPQLREEE